MDHKSSFQPKRIVCLTEEPTEWLYILGEEDRIVGISGFTRRPERARKEKPIVSTFIDAKIDEILALKPDLVIGFSDIQAQIAHDLIKAGVTVWINNYRSVRGVLSMMYQLGSMVGKEMVSLEWIVNFEHRVSEIDQEIRQWKVTPKIYIEEWYDPLITGIEWFSELVEIAGGQNVFPALSKQSLGKDRIITDPAEVIEKNPDIIIASWCGKMFKEQKMIARPGWDKITAVRNGDLYEIKSEIILQPGPAALSAGLDILHLTFKEWVSRN